MKNPYSDSDIHPSRLTFSRKWQRIFSLLFLAGILAEPARRHADEWGKNPEERWLPLAELWRHPNTRSYNLFYEKKAINPDISRDQPSLADHLRAFEEGIKESDHRQALQSKLQSWITAAYQKGNRKVYIGRESWLYYQPGIDALTGRGPFVPEPDSVTKDPDRPHWRDALSAIFRFADQLKERDIQLMAVPIPVKPMVETEGLGMTGLIRHPDHDQFFEALRERSIVTIDLLPWFAEARQRGENCFLRQDTHWTAALAKRSARVVANQVRAMPWYESAPKSPPPDLQSATRSAPGDLAGMLKLPGLFKDESQVLERVLDPATGLALEGDLYSPVTILGDSFINIYEEPGLGFGEARDGGLIGAGFASHFAAFTGLTPHVIAINGEGASGVRQAFAALPDNVVRGRKLVIWAIACRDFFLSESAALKAGVNWKDVTFNALSEQPGEGKTPSGESFIEMAATLRKKSSIGDPRKTSYAEAIYACEFDQVKVLSGEYYEKEAHVFLWAFRDRRLCPEARLEPGRTYRLKLISIETREDLLRKTLLDDFNRFDLDRMFATEIVPWP